MNEGPAISSRIRKHLSRDQRPRMPWGQAHRLPGHSFGERIASNFAILGVAEISCRAISVIRRSRWRSGWDRRGSAGSSSRFRSSSGSFSSSGTVLRPLSHERLRDTLGSRGTMVNHVLAVKLAFAVGILVALAVVSLFSFSEATDRWVLILYGLLLLTTAMGLDFVYRGKETMGLVAVSLLVRTSIYCVGVWYCVHDASQILMVPLWLACGEFTGIALVWVVYARKFGVPRPVLGLRFLIVFLRRGRSIGLIHLCQAVLISADFLVVGLMNPWSDVGRYGAAHRIISAVMAFGMIFQQVVFPSLSRNWRASSEAGRRLLDFSVRILVSGFIPIAVGGSLLAEPLVRFLLPTQEYHEAGMLLAIGIWKAPLLSLAFLYQASLIVSDEPGEPGIEASGPGSPLFGADDCALALAIRDAGGVAGGSGNRVGIGHRGVLLPGAGAVPAIGASSPGAAGSGLLGDESGMRPGIKDARRGGCCRRGHLLSPHHETDRRARLRSRGVRRRLLTPRGDRTMRPGVNMV